MANKFNFDKVIEKLKAVKSNVPRLIANDTKNYFVRSFNSQEWDGKAWQEPKRKSKVGGSSRNQSATLVQSGRLRRAVINSFKKATFQSIEFEVQDVPYAKVHNEGLRAGRGKGFQMPKRAFMGQTKKLTDIQKGRLKSEVDKIWK